MKRFASILLVLCMALVFHLLLPDIAMADLTVYYLDVGQGDAAIIVCDGEAMIIDGGLPGQSDKIFTYVQDRLHIDHFIYMIATHPDNDHIGGLPAVFTAVRNKKYPIEIIYSPVKEDESPRFGKLKEKADEYHVKIQIPHDGDKKYLGEATVLFYNCGHTKKTIVRSMVDTFKSFFHRDDDPEEKKENNAISLVVKIIYGETTFLFTGDIEKDTEQTLISSGFDLKADVLKVAHHGSSSSSSYDFLTEISPKYAVISCGEGNSYGHPEQATLDELKGMDIELYRTDLQGTIICHSDGHTITFETEKTAKSNVFTTSEK